MKASKDNAFGNLLKNGSWTGMKGQIQRKVIQLKIQLYYYMNYVYHYSDKYIGLAALAILFKKPRFLARP